jgi:uncharacterized protein YndB with AHSA1/START domain
MQKPSFVVDKEKLQVVMSYVYDAPRELVWKTYNDPDMIPKFWGPRNLTTTVEKMDVKVGGEWRFVQTDEKGEKFVFYGKYLELTPPKKAVMTFEFEPWAGHVITETMTLEEMDSKTKMTTVSQFENIQDLEGMISSGMESGAVESVERMAELLQIKTLKE